MNSKVTETIEEKLEVLQNKKSIEEKNKTVYEIINLIYLLSSKLSSANFKQETEAAVQKILEAQKINDFNQIVKETKKIIKYYHDTMLEATREAFHKVYISKNKKS